MSVTSQPLPLPHLHRPSHSPPTMSTASTVITSVAHDLTLGDEHEIANSTCILVATQNHGTPFPHDSFQEEDLVELHVGLGQEHPEGVLQLSDTKVVIAF